MIKINRTELRDKITACWIGKNIGGTIGAPYEWTQEILDLKGFSTEEGEVLPNDDLDLQLIWLKAIDRLGPDGINEKVLGEYWLNYIMPHWNEYGVGKSNMRAGFYPPLSGELNNTHWKNSNGAWIRTEIWSCLYPGCPEKAINFAFNDACVDHGFGEGTYAAIFIAAIESAAFVFDDINTLLDIGLSKIPSDCRVARSVNMVRQAYKDGLDWKEIRENLVKDSADIGWFQAPANIGFVIIGLLYGEGDFKKSMLLAVNCGDDTDCTGATIGSILSIIGGTKAIPSDWANHIGLKIEQNCLLNGHGLYPTTIEQLVDGIFNLLPTTLRKSIYRYDCSDVEIVDGESDFSEITPKDYFGTDFVEKMFNRSRFSFTANATFFDALIEFEKEPRLLPGESLKGKLTVINKGNPSPEHFNLYWFLPEGWTVTGSRHLFVPTNKNVDDAHFVEFVLTAGETQNGVAHIGLEVSESGKLGCAYFPINILQ